MQVNTVNGENLDNALRERLKARMAQEDAEEERRIAEAQEKAEAWQAELEKKWAESQKVISGYEASQALLALPDAVIVAISRARRALGADINFRTEPIVQVDGRLRALMETDYTQLDDADLGFAVQTLRDLAGNAGSSVADESKRATEAQFDMARFERAVDILDGLRPAVLALMGKRVEAAIAALDATRANADAIQATLDAAQAEYEDRQPMKASEIKAAIAELRAATAKPTGKSAKQ